MSPAFDIAALRDRIRRLETPARHGVLPFGLAALDRALPGGGLALGAVHEIVGQDGDEEDGAAAAGFIAGILARLGRPTSSRRFSETRTSGGASFETRPGFRSAAPQEEVGSLVSHIDAPHPEEPAPSRRRLAAAPQDEERASRRAHDANAALFLAVAPILWCVKRPDLYGPGLLAHGLDPARLVIVCAPRDDDILWAVEEGLRCPGLAAVVGEVGRLPMIAGRRLQLAAERSGVTALLLRRWRNAREAAAERARPSAAATRWRVPALSSAKDGEPGVGRPRWRVELLRCRGGEPAAWDVESADATGSLSLSAGLADRPAAPHRRPVAPLPEQLPGRLAV